MHIRNFEPEHFVIHSFGGKDTCFAWKSSDEFIIFPYICNKTEVTPRFLKAPAKIKDIREHNGKIFILCFPQGIYELSEQLEIATFSATGLELVSERCVLAIKDETLVFEDRGSDRLVKLPVSSAIISIYLLPLYYTDNPFYRALSAVEEGKSDVCLLAVNKKLFKLVNKNLQLIYQSDYLIKNIVAFEKQNQVFGTLLQTDDSSNVILLHAINSKIIFDSIFLGVVVQAIHPVLCTDKKVLLIYSDQKKTHYSSTILTTSVIREQKSENKTFSSIKPYQSNFLIFLDECSNLLQFPMTEIKNLCEESTSDFVGLQSNMLKGLESVIQCICEKTLELKILRIEMLQKEDCLRRINIFVNKQSLKYCPSDSVVRFLNHVFLVSNFRKSLFENSTVVKVLKSGGKTIFFLQDVHDHDTIVEMPINFSSLSSKLCTTTDLITCKSNNGIWCLIKNYVQDPLTCKSNTTILSCDKLNIIKYNLVVLKNLLKENKHSLESLSEIKRKIRDVL